MLVGAAGREQGETVMCGLLGLPVGNAVLWLAEQHFPLAEWELLETQELLGFLGPQRREEPHSEKVFIPVRMESWSYTLLILIC